MKIVLHIGIHKTGTTAIQAFMARNKKRFQSLGILYPAQYTNGDGHHPLPWALGVAHRERDEKIKASDIASATLEEVRQARADTIILSSEEFRNINAKWLPALKELFPQATFRVIVYLRRQDDYLVSEYGQHVRSYPLRFSGTVHDFYVKYNFPSRYNYWLLLDRWARVFGEESIAVRIYDRKRFPDGNVIADFLQAISIDSAGFEMQAEVGINRNLSPIALEILRRLNSREVGKETHRKLVALLDKGFNGAGRKFELISAKNRRDLLAVFRPSNGLVAQKWLNREVLFDEPDDDAPLTYELPDQSTLVEALLDCLITATRQAH